jgi:hypothetical protein
MSNKVVSNISIATKYGFRPKEAAFALGSEKLLEECLEAGWLKPIIQRHKLTLYDRGHIASCWARILGGETPSEECARQAAGTGNKRRGR